MSTATIITALGVFILLVYGLTRILEFYGMNMDSYGSYVAFYTFLLVSAFILPRNYYKLKLLND